MISCHGVTGVKGQGQQIGWSRETRASGTFSHLVIAADAALPVQSGALHTRQHHRYTTDDVTSVSIKQLLVGWLVGYLSARCPELPLEELELHLDANS